MTPLPWQTEPIARIADIANRGRSAVDASDPGVGKTVVALLAAKKLGARLGVLCPKSVVPAWERTAAKIGVKLAYCCTVEKLKAGNTPHLRRTAEGFKLRLPSDVIPVFDEAHLFSGAHSENGLVAATAPSPCWFISATLTDSPLKMRALLHNLGLVSYGHWYSWCLSVGCEAKPLRFTGTDVNLLPIRKKIFPERGVRVRIEELGDLFPAEQLRVEMLPVKNEKLVDGYGLEHADAELQLVPALTELIESDLDAGFSVIVFTSYRKTQEALAKKFDAALIYGAQEDREEQRLSYQAGRKRVLLAMVQCGGAALDAHDTVGDRPRSTYILPVRQTAFAKQALGRARRVGGKSRVRQAFVFPDTDFGRRVQFHLESKAVVMSAFNDAVLGEGLW
jgi:hypothetical protein